MEKFIMVYVFGISYIENNGSLSHSYIPVGIIRIDCMEDSFMKKAVGFIVLMMMVFLSCSAQNSSSKNLWGFYAGAVGGDLQNFKRRYNEIKTDGSFTENYWGFYAGAVGGDLQNFKRRYNEIKTDGSFTENYWGFYAGAVGGDLQNFKRRYNEIKTDGSFPEKL